MADLSTHAGALASLHKDVGDMMVALLTEEKRAGDAVIKGDYSPAALDALSRLRVATADAIARLRDASAAMGVRKTVG